MKLSAEQLLQQLKKELASVYLIGGDEILLVQEATQSIRTAAKQHEFHERKIFQIDTGFDWNEFLMEANHLSLFSEKTLLELHLPEGKLNDAGKNALEIYNQQPPPDKILLIITGKLDSKISNTNWFKQIEKAGVVVQLWPMDANKLPQWISQRLQQAGLTTNHAGIQLLAELTEGNLLATQQAIEKLRLHYGTATLTADEIAAVITDNARFDIFNLVDQALAGNSKKIIAIVNSLKAEDGEPTLILWALARELRNLIAMKNSLQNGQALPQIFLQFKVWEKRKLIIKQALQRHSLENLFHLLQHASQLDRLIKGAANGNFWDQLLDLTLSMAGIKLMS